MSERATLINYYPLRIPAGWKVDFNNLYEDSPHPAHDKYSSIFTASSEICKKAIDVNYRPDESGQFCFEMNVHPVLATYDQKSDALRWTIEFEVSLFKKQFKGLKDLVAEIERLMIQSEEYIDPRIIDEKGRIVEGAERLRQQLSQKGLNHGLVEEILRQKQRKLEKQLLEDSRITAELLGLVIEKSSFKKTRNIATTMLKQSGFRS